MDTRARLRKSLSGHSIPSWLDSSALVSVGIMFPSQGTGGTLIGGPCTFAQGSLRMNVSNGTLYVKKHRRPLLEWADRPVLGGHQSFSESKTLNNAVGFVLHSALLVPYHSWRISVSLCPSRLRELASDVRHFQHAKHHAATGHMTKDQVHVPFTRSQKGIPSEDELAVQKRGPSTFEQLDDLLEDSPLWTAVDLVVKQILGWPLYITFNTHGQAHYPKWTNRAPFDAWG